ncbi:MAG: hypothetical protein RR346_08800 [Bacteroidales bacterium]
MKGKSILGIALFITPAVMAQTITDVYRYTKTDMVGTARYMGMGGAFGALGGDITTLSQNPAGIGVYRSSEVVATLSLGGIESKTSIPQNSSVTRFGDQSSKFNINCNNLGYVGTFITGKRSGLVNFNVGFTFNRQGGGKRTYRVSQQNMPSSLSDYFALAANHWGGDPGSLVQPQNLRYDPYSSTDAPWGVIMAYNTGIISYNNGAYHGLYSSPEEIESFVSDGNFIIEDNSRIDEYSFNFGGNFSNKVYWGLGVGIRDLNIKQNRFYDESFFDLNDQNQSLGVPTSYSLANALRVTGTGVNVKAGVILRPTNTWRLGIAIHTPTWYKITDSYIGNINVFNPQQNASWTSFGTPDDAFDYKLRTPWKFQFSTAWVLGKNGLISFEYNLEDYSTNHLSDDGGFDLSYSETNADFKRELKAMHTIKVGGEIRLSPAVSLRLGYANQLSGFKNSLKNEQGAAEYINVLNPYSIIDMGIIPAYYIDHGTQYYTGGLGYRFGSFFTDVAFVWSHQKQDLYLADYWNDNINFSKVDLTNNAYKFVLTMGYKF